MLRPDDFQKSQLVLVSWRYGQEYGGYLPALMIMNCIANRVKGGWGTWLDVINRIPYFSAQIEQPTGFPQIWQPDFTRLLHEVEGVYSNAANDLSKGGLYWADLRRVDNSWFRDHILKFPEIHPRIVESNSLAIFK